MEQIYRDWGLGGVTLSSKQVIGKIALIHEKYKHKNMTSNKEDKNEWSLEDSE